jgi:hypothetical protein
MRYNNSLSKPSNNPGMMPVNDQPAMGLVGDASMQMPTVSTPRTAYNPGIKPSGAPVNFNPKAQASMTGMFGMPEEGTYDRALPVSPTI